MQCPGNEMPRIMAYGNMFPSLLWHLCTGAEGPSGESTVLCHPTVFALPCLCTPLASTLQCLFTPLSSALTHLITQGGVYVPPTWDLSGSSFIPRVMFHVCGVCIYVHSWCWLLFMHVCMIDYPYDSVHVSVCVSFIAPSTLYVRVYVLLLKCFTHVSVL